MKDEQGHIGNNQTLYCFYGNNSNDGACRRKGTVDLGNYSVYLHPHECM